ncbi:glutathione hydrolase 1 proenzyme-like isoform X2 [Antedon mediterranea]|uniref:glutathione hydrolase 1 proenzyme-like isoform X2 n=1 Tax=Antedon mediterranea TaxID=105859 RepID=UPI003AF8E0F1
MATGKPSYDSLGIDIHEEGSNGISDKQLLITDRNTKAFHEAVPLNETHAYQHEEICGYDGLKVIVLSSIIFGLAITIAMVITIVSGMEQITPKGAVSTGSQQCSDIGGDILKDQGSAVDAAIAAMFCIGVVHSQSGGIGGGGFMMVYEANSESSNVFDFQATAPSDATEDMFASDADLAKYGAKAVAVPGELLGMQVAHDAYGKKKWSELVSPASKLAREGFTVSSTLSNAINATNAEQMSEKWRSIYTPNGTPLKAGETLVLSSLADTLDKIGEVGPEAYFRNEFMTEVINALTDEGLIKTDDFDKYNVFQASPLAVDYGNYSIYSPPAPSGGPGLLSILNILNDYDFSTSTDEALRYHYTIEAIKFAKAQMLHLGDPSFVDSVDNYTDIMLSDSTAEGIREQISTNSTHDIEFYTEFANSLSASGTSHISVLDESNNDLVSITNSLNSDFGSGIMTEGGVILNNIMDQFYWQGKSATGLLESTTNNIESGKRPQTFQAPSLVWDLNDKCEPHMAIGGKSGSNTIDAIAQVLISFLSLEKDLNDAINERNHVYHSLEPNTVVAESDVPADVISELRDKGHIVEESTSGSLSAVFAVYESYDTVYCSADSREKDSGVSEF